MAAEPIMVPLRLKPHVGQRGAQVQRPKSITLLTVIGIAITGLGLALSFDLVSAPNNRIAGQLDSLMFFGPIILIVGGVVLGRAATAAGLANERATPALAKAVLGLGVGLVLIPALLLAHSIIARSDRTGFLFTITVFLLGLPGLVLIGVATRRLRNRKLT